MIAVDYKRYLARIAWLGGLGSLGGIAAILAVQFDNEFFAAVGFAVLAAGVMAAAILIVIGQFRYGKRAITDGLSAAQEWHGKDNP